MIFAYETDPQATWTAAFAITTPGGAATIAEDQATTTSGGWAGMQALIGCSQDTTNTRHERGSIPNSVSSEVRIWRPLSLR